MFKTFERILGLLVFGPPLYMVARWLRWYFRGRRAEREAQANEA